MSNPDGDTAHPYATLAYAMTLEHVGTPRHVAAWGTFVLQRRISHALTDIAGVYPLTMMGHSPDVAEGLDDLRRAGAVSAVFVSDHQDGSSQSDFQRAFSLAREFKQHHVVDRLNGSYKPNRHHLTEIRRAERRGVVVEWVGLEEVLADWIALYDELILRHAISGAPRFSRSAFEALAKCEGLRVVRARIDDSVVGCHLWILHRDAVWSHLGATNEHGRRNGASYAMYDFSIREFENKVISLGGGAGLTPSHDDGLAQFKAGFANRQVMSYVYGAILDAREYGILSERASAEGTTFFPAYRSPTMEAIQP